MLRRILTFTFALLLFALAFSIPDAARGPAPPNITSVQRESPALLVMGNLFLPRAAIAQAVAHDTGAGTVDTTPASALATPDKSSHSLRNVFGGLALIGLAILVVLFFRRRKSGESEYDRSKRTT